MSARRAASLATVLMVALAGCGDTADTESGGEIIGTTLTVYSLLPDTPTGRDIVDGQKLALSEGGGAAGAYKVNFSSDFLQGEPAAVADTVREAMRDPQIVAAVADLDSDTARVSIPLLNGAGVLHVSPGATYAGFTSRFPGSPPGEPERWQPAAQRTFAPLLASDAAQAEAIARAARGPVVIETEAGDADRALADLVRRRLGDAITQDTRRARTIVYSGSDAESALGVVESLTRENPRARILLSSALLRTDLRRRLPERARVAFVDAAGPAPDGFVVRFEKAFGRCPGPYAHLGHAAMAGVLGAIDATGKDAGKRIRVIRAYFESRPPREAAAQPFFLVSGRGCTPRYEPVG